MTRVSQLWDLIETWGFCVDIKDIVVGDVIDAANDANDANDTDNNDDKDDNDYKGISALGLDRDMGFFRGHQGRQEHLPHDDDDDDEEEDNEEEDNEVEDNNKEDNNNKDNNNDKGISALGLDTDLGFSRGH